MRKLRKLFVPGTRFSLIGSPSGGIGTHCTSLLVPRCGSTSRGGLLATQGASAAFVGVRPRRLVSLRGAAPAQRAGTGLGLPPLLSDETDDGSCSELGAVDVGVVRPVLLDDCNVPPPGTAIEGVGAEIDAESGMPDADVSGLSGT